MKKILMTLAAVLCCMTSTTTLTSCSIEDNPAPIPVISETPFGDLLKGVDNITSIEAFTPNQNKVGFTEFYEVFFRQPIDHNNPSVGTIKQKAFLFFKGFDRPTVMYTSGYGLSDAWKNYTHLDIAANMDANLIIVEHRYFGDSKNLDDTRWDYLTIEQAAADHHAIFQSLKPLLPKEWVSTGTSKDGMTSLFYRYFYPNDMTVTTVFCSPFMTSLYYKPIGTYLEEESGSDAERENMHAIYNKLLENLENENNIYNTYVQMCEKYNAQLQELHPEQTYPWFDSSLSTYVFSLPNFFFSQFSYNTAKERALNIPSADAEPEVILDYIYFRNILTQNGLWKYNSPLAPAAEEEDYYWKTWTDYPYYIQTAKQLGQLSYDFSRYVSLIGEVPQNSNPSGLFEQDLWLYDTYDNSRIKDIRENFLPTTNCPILFYYAKSDPWTGARPDKINESNTMMLIGERGVHNQDLNNPEHFSQDDKLQIMDFLARYVNYENATTKARRRASADLPTVSIEPDYFMIPKH